MANFLVVELGDVVSTVLEHNPCEKCGAILQFSHTERNGENSWFVYTKCPNGCFDEDEYHLFKIERILD